MYKGNSYNQPEEGTPEAVRLGGSGGVTPPRRIRIVPLRNGQTPPKTPPFRAG